MAKKINIFYADLGDDYCGDAKDWIKARIASGYPGYSADKVDMLAAAKDMMTNAGHDGFDWLIWYIVEHFPIAIIKKISTKISAKLPAISSDYDVVKCKNNINNFNTNESRENFDKVVGGYMKTPGFIGNKALINLALTEIGVK